MQSLADRAARRRANHRIAFLGHALVWAGASFLFLLLLSVLHAIIVSLAWGIGLAAHGFWAVLAPELRERWARAHDGSQARAAGPGERREHSARHARSIEQLAASIAHEIRQPVTAAKSLVQQMGEDPASPDNVEYARVALEELDRVERSISHLLRFAREEELAVGEVRLAEVVGSALDGLRDRTSKGVEVRVDVAADVELRADAEKLRRVVLNLVGNALDALRDSAVASPRVQVSAGLDLAGTEVWLRVRDNGPGIDPARADKIFDPFHTSKNGGTGLGLAITRKLVEAHGGSIAVESGAGGAGTSFLVTLPRAGVA